MMIVKLEHRRDKFVPIGWMEIYGPIGSGDLLPSGWVPADGKCYLRRLYPEAAALFRRFTPWWRWHILSQFRVPKIERVYGRVV